LPDTNKLPVQPTNIEHIDNSLRKLIIYAEMKINETKYRQTVLQYVTTAI